MRYLTGLFLLISVILHSQNTVDFDFIITNPKSIYSTHDAVSYIIHTKTLEQKNIVQITLEDSMCNVVFKKFLLVDNNVYQGQFKIPSILRTGVYKIWGSLTNGTSKPFHMYDLTVVNPQNFSQTEINSMSQIATTKESKPLTSVNIDNPLKISGNVSMERQPLNNELIILQSRGATNKYAYTLSDEEGNFSFYDSLYGENELFISTLTNHWKKKIILTHFEYQNDKEIKTEYFPFKINEEQLKKVDSVKKMVIDYNNYEAPKEKNIKFFSNINFDKEFIVEEYMSMSTTIETIKEIIPLKKIKTNKNNTALYLLNDFDNTFHKVEPVYLVDGFIVDNFNIILDLDISTIKTISTSYKYSYTNLASFGRATSYGIFAITTTNGNYIPENGSYTKFVGLER